ncbi:MAG: L,D-transpeptidase family protein [Sciscionella sp.]
MRARKTARATAAIVGAALIGIGAPAVASATGTADQAASQATAAKSRLVPGTPCPKTTRACLSLSRHRAWLIKNGHASYGGVKITTGKRGQETPRGLHHVIWKDIDHLSHEFNNAPMPFSVFFVPGIAFHEGSLYRQSNGCVHLSHKSAVTFYNALHVGDPVYVAR